MAEDLFSRGIGFINRERQRQVDEEGYTADHDDRHRNNELPRAAIAYAKASCGVEHGEPAEWPWVGNAFKRGEPIRMLAKAGALIAAEIDRRLRDVPDRPWPEMVRTTVDVTGVPSGREHKFVAYGIRLAPKVGEIEASYEVRLCGIEGVGCVEFPLGVPYRKEPEALTEAVEVAVLAKASTMAISFMNGGK